MLLSFRDRPSRGDAPEVARVYLETLDGLSPRSVQEAADQYRLGKVPDQHFDFAPSAVALRRRAEMIEKRLEREALGLPRPQQAIGYDGLAEPVALPEEEVRRRAEFAAGIIAKTLQPAPAMEADLAQPTTTAEHDTRWLEETRVRRSEKLGIDPYPNPKGWNPTPELLAILEGEKPE